MPFSDYLSIESNVGILVFSLILEPALSMESTASLIEAPQARIPYADSLEIPNQPCLHREQPTIRGPKKGFRVSMSLVIHAFSWPSCRLGHSGDPDLRAVTSIDWAY